MTLFNQLNKMTIFAILLSLLFFKFQTYGTPIDKSENKSYKPFFINKLEYYNNTYGKILIN